MANEFAKNPQQKEMEETVILQNFHVLLSTEERRACEEKRSGHLIDWDRSLKDMNRPQDNPAHIVPVQRSSEGTKHIAEASIDPPRRNEASLVYMKTDRGTQK
ncbi:hypothetical protein N7519_005662 [Penicillium mononematosum]|uniref:uncharacterized protein n=1 Tax=Penicillium mononematosum TaxID=268346 RepID=UPI00254800F7|nr:uncharacterized protein N7519_005662 [Penicillium mononematosum]KAJ6184361.1 hypothetical protein N7519_005662 [Penicillium mononematosum]